jgi:hypothetical protein
VRLTPTTTVLIILALASWAHVFGRGAGHATSRCSGCLRTPKGRIKRSEAAVARFKRDSGYPHGRKGYVIDHIVPLCAGGADEPANMQWQTVEQAKVKDQQERLQCHK